MNAKEIRNQAASLQDQYKYEQSTKLYQQAYMLYEQSEDWEQAADCLIQQVYNKLQESVVLEKRMEKELEHQIQGNQAFVLQKLGKEHLFSEYIQLQFAQFYLAIGEWERAEKMAKQLLEKLLPILQHGHAYIKEIYLLIVHCHIHNPDKEKQLECLQETLELFLSKEPLYRKEVVLVYQKIASYYIYIDSAKALTFLKQAVAIVQQLETEDKLVMRGLYSSLGIIHYERRDLEKALLYFQKALGIAIEQDINSSSIIKLYANIGNCFNIKCLHDQAKWYCEKAIERAHQLYDNQWFGLVILYGNYGLLLNRLDSFQEALNAFHTGLQIYEGLERKNPIWQDYLYFGIEETYRLKGDYQESINFLEKIINGTVFNSKRDLKKNINVLMNMGLNYSILKAYEQSLDYLQQALQMDEGGFEESSKYINPNIDEVQQIVLITKALGIKGNVLAEIMMDNTNWCYKDVQMSLFCVQSAEKLLQKIYDSLSLEESKTNLGEIQNRTQDFVISKLITALPFIQKDPVAFEKATTSIMQLNAAYTNPHTFPYIMNETQCKEQAFAYSEQFKARVLLENLRVNQAILNANLPAHIIDQEARLKKEMIELHKQVRQAETKLTTVTKEEQEKYIQQIVELQSQQLAKHEEYEHVKKQLAEFHPVYSQNEEAEKIVSIAEFQQLLLPHQLLLSYFVLEQEGVIIFSIQKHCFDIHKVSMHQNMGKLVKKLLKSINQLRYTKFVKLARDLYQFLLAPVLDSQAIEKIQELIIIPHQELSYIPFECLLNADIAPNEESNYSKLPYLIQSYQINYHYSASLFYRQLQLQKDKEYQEDSFIGFAPVYSQQAPSQATGESETYTPQELEAITTSSRSVRIGNQEYDALIHSEKEITEVEQLFTNKNKTAQSFLHENATVEQFKKSVANKKYIHIAAHGFETKSENGLTGIIFSPESQDETPEDAVLYLPDMYTLQLHAELVVLSSCKSGIGRLQGGEGMMAMNRGFLAAGAQNVVYTLFKIYDQASSEFVKFFFEQIIVHQNSYKEALQVTKKYMIEKEEFTPKHWAGFVLIGQ